MLTLSGYRLELKKMEERGLICPCLVETITFLIERKMMSHREHSIADLPILCDGIRQSIRDYTDDGRILIDGKPFQLCALKAPKLPKKEPRLTLVDTFDPCYQVCSLW